MIQHNFINNNSQYKCKGTLRVIAIVRNPDSGKALLLKTILRNLQY